MSDELVFDADREAKNKLINGDISLEEYLKIVKDILENMFSDN